MRLDIPSIMSHIDGSRSARINTFTAVETLLQSIDGNVLTDFVAGYTEDYEVISAVEDVSKRVLAAFIEIKYEAIDEGILTAMKNNIVNDSLERHLREVSNETQKKAYNFFEKQVDVDALHQFMIEKMGTKSTKVLGAMNMVKNQVGSYKHGFFKKLKKES
jgi:hypothetical protein